MLIIIILVFIFGLIKLININTSYSATSDKIGMDDMYKAIKEVMYSYYMRGNSINYSDSKTLRYFPPESATSQNARFTVCAGYATTVYKELADITIPWSSRLIEYASQHQNSPEVVRYGDRGRAAGGRPRQSGEDRRGKARNRPSGKAPAPMLRRSGGTG